MALSDDQLAVLRSMSNEDPATNDPAPSLWSVLVWIVIVALFLGAVRVAVTFQVPHASTAWLICRYALAIAGAAMAWLLLWNTLLMIASRAERSEYTLLVDLAWTTALVWIAVPPTAVAWLSGWASSAPAWHFAVIVVAFFVVPFALGRRSVSFVAELEFKRVSLRASLAGIAAVFVHGLGKRDGSAGNQKVDSSLTNEFSDIPPRGDASMSTATGEWKSCPDCAEKVRAQARVCRFCRYAFEKEPS